MEPGRIDLLIRESVISDNIKGLLAQYVPDMELKKILPGI
jgi:hypothetical protein